MAKNSGSGLVGWLVIIVIVGALAGAGYWYWKNQGDKGIEYKTSPVTRGDIIQVVTATGQLNPKTNVDVGSQVSGILNKIYVDFNSEVTNHQVIAELDPSSYKAIVAGASADLASARAALELAKAEEKRTSSLFDAKIVTGTEYDTAVASLHQAEAVVMQKEASLQQANVNLAYTTIYAPVNGVVISRNVDVGQTVAASLSSPTLFMIANDLKQMQIDALVSEADIGGVETNQEVNFLVDAFPTRTFQGVVIQIRNAAQTNQNVITYDTVIGVDNSELKLRPGMTANVSIVTAQKKNVLKIPNGALRFHPMEPGDLKKESNMVAQSSGGGGPGGGGGRQGGGGGGFGGGGPGGGGGGRQGGGGPGGPGGPGGGGHPRGEARPTRAIYVLAKSADGKTDIAKPVQVKIGIGDGISTQLVDGLNEGDEVIVGQNVPGAPAGSQSAPSNPFGGGRRF